MAHEAGGQLRHLPSGHPDLFQFGRGSDRWHWAELVTLQGTVGGAAGDGAPLPAEPPLPFRPQPGTLLLLGMPLNSLWRSQRGAHKTGRNAFCRSIEAAGCVSPVDLPVYSAFTYHWDPYRTVGVLRIRIQINLYIRSIGIFISGTRKPLCNNASFQLLNRLVITCCGDGHVDAV